MKHVIVIVIVVWATLSPLLAWGSDACLSSFQSAQEHKKASALLAATRDLTTCGQAECPAVVRSKCIEWLEEVKKAQPSVVISVTGADGRDTRAAKVTVDGTVVREILDGRPIELDPGSHEIVVEHGGASHTERIVLAEGQKSREIALSFAPASEEKADGEDGGGISPLLFVGAGVAAVGLVIGAVTGGLALDKSSDLDEVCSDRSRCTEAGREPYDEGLALSHASTAGFVVAGVGAAIAVVGIVLSDFGAGDVEVALGLRGIAIGGRF